MSYESESDYPISINNHDSITGRSSVSDRLETEPLDKPNETVENKVIDHLSFLLFLGKSMQKHREEHLKDVNNDK